MNVTLHFQTPKSQKQSSLAGVITACPDMQNCRVLRVAVAYATVSGVRTLLASMAAKALDRSYWLVGLDDAITQPGAIDLIRKTAGAELRVATYENVRFRFHPKVYSFDFDADMNKTVLIIGSNNLTSAAMVGNGEAFVTLHPSGDKEFKAATLFWKQLWAQGHEPKSEELNSYRTRYEKAKHARAVLEKTVNPKKPVPPQKEVLTSDETELDPFLANTCWIECGAVTLMGRELEFKAEQGMFFGLSPNGENAKFFKFRVSNGKHVQLRMKYQPNHMWRLQMNAEVPEVKIGLRPRLPNGSLGRSPYVAVFKRTSKPDVFDLSFVTLTSSIFKSLREKSQKFGAIGHTTARQYGWC